MADTHDVGELIFFIMGAFGVAGQLEQLLKSIMREPMQNLLSFANVEDDFNSKEKLMKAMVKDLNKSEYEHNKLAHAENKDDLKQIKKEHRKNFFVREGTESMDDFEKKFGEIIEQPLPNKQDARIFRDLIRSWNIRHRSDGRGVRFATYKVNNEKTGEPMYVIGFSARDAETIQEIAQQFLKMKNRERKQDKGRKPIGPALEQAKERARSQENPDRHREEVLSH